jgi:ribokinase
MSDTEARTLDRDGAEGADAALGPIAVVGSLNMDLVVRVLRLPGPGETVTGDDVFRNPGGKGGNQAVAAARLGRTVSVVACVGEDEAGRSLLDALRADGVDTGHVRIDERAPTGAAFIAVGPDGENQIIVSPGANGRLTPDDVQMARPLLERAAVTLLQLEIPLDVVAEAAQAAHGSVVLNPAPARELPSEVLALADVVVPNRVELGQLANESPPASADEAAGLAVRLPVPAVVVTLGAEGALVVEGGAITPVPPVVVRPIDTTAAGDAFCGALADALARGEGLDAAARWAARVAALACTKPGAQSSLPTRDEVLHFGPGAPPP